MLRQCSSNVVFLTAILVTFICFCFDVLPTFRVHPLSGRSLGYAGWKRLLDPCLHLVLGHYFGWYCTSSECMQVYHYASVQGVSVYGIRATEMNLWLHQQSCSCAGVQRWTSYPIVFRIVCLKCSIGLPTTCLIVDGWNNSLLWTVW